MKTQNESQLELIKKYEIQLAKVVKTYSGDWRKEDYITYAEQALEAVRNGRGW